MSKDLGEKLTGEGFWVELSSTKAANSLNKSDMLREGLREQTGKKLDVK